MVERVHLQPSIFSNGYIVPVLLDNCPLKGSFQVEKWQKTLEFAYVLLKSLNLAREWVHSLPTWESFTPVLWNYWRRPSAHRCLNASLLISLSKFFTFNIVGLMRNLKKKHALYEDDKKMTSIVSETLIQGYTFLG